MAMSHYSGEILLIILWMSYFLYPRLISFLTTVKTVSQQEKRQNATRVISKFTQILDLPLSNTKITDIAAFLFNKYNFSIYPHIKWSSRYVIDL